MKAFLVLALFLIVIAGAGYFTQRHIQSLQAEIAAQELLSDGLSAKIEQTTLHYERQLTDLNTLREERDKAIAERDHYRRAFQGFNERLLADPVDSECRINRASDKVANRIAHATGGQEIENPLECD